MQLVQTVFDASFWINAHEVAVLDFLSDYFILYSPNIVINEILHPLSTTGMLSPAGKALQEWLNKGKITIQNPVEAVNWFQPGENAAIALAKEQGCRLLIDDQNPYHRAKSHGLSVTGSADFILFLYIQKRLSYEETLSRLRYLSAGKHLTRQVLGLLGELARVRGDKP